MARIYLVEAAAFNPATDTSMTLRWATRGYNHPSAPGYYAGDIVQPLDFTRSLDGILQPEARDDWGALTVKNPDGKWDAIAGYSMAGRALTVLFGEDGDAYSSFTTLYVGTMGQPDPQWKQVVIPVRDRLSELDVPLNDASRYDGSNSLPDGLEGTEDDIAGEMRPLPAGAPINVSPRIVNTSKLIGQFNDGAGADLTALYDGGVALTRDTDYADQSELLDDMDAPASGYYKVLPDEGYFRLGASPNYGITCDVEYGSAGDRTAAQTISRYAQQAPTISSGDISSADVTALDAANGSAIGWWPGANATVREGCRAASASVGAHFGFDRLGVLRMSRIVAPESGSSVATLRRLDFRTPGLSTDANIIEIESLPPRDTEIPVWQVICPHSRNWTPQTDALDVNISDARRAYVAQDWRRTPPESDPDTLSDYPVARTLDRETYLVENADTEAARLLALLQVPRRRWRVRVRFTSSFITTVDLAAIITIQVDRYGLDAGKKFLVTRMSYDARLDIADLEVWG